jgi:hypothetical protein
MELMFVLLDIAKMLSFQDVVNMKNYWKPDTGGSNL